MIAQLVLATILVIGDPPAESPAPSDAASESIDVRYARAQFHLAEANLQRVQQMNQRLARTVPASVVAEYQHDLDVAKLHMQHAESSTVTDGFSVWLRQAEAIWKNADTIWKNAVTINQDAPRTFQALDVERFRLRAEVTRLQLERGKHLAHAPRDAQLQWQIELVNNEVQQLKEDARAAPYSRVGRVWWWW